MNNEKIELCLNFDIWLVCYNGAISRILKYKNGLQMGFFGNLVL